MKRVQKMPEYHEDSRKTDIEQLKDYLDYVLELTRYNTETDILYDILTQLCTMKKFCNNEFNMGYTEAIIAVMKYLQKTYQIKDDNDFGDNSL